MYKTAQIFKRGFLAQSKCTTRVPHSDRHLRKPHCFRRKGRRWGVRIAATSPPPWYLLQFHRWRKVSRGSFPVNAWPAHRFSQVGLLRQQRPRKTLSHKAKGHKARGHRRSALGGRGCPVRAAGLLVGPPLAQRGVFSTRERPSQFNTGPKITSSVNVLRETSTALSSMKLQVSGNQESIRNTPGV